MLKARHSFCTIVFFCVLSRHAFAEDRSFVPGDYIVVSAVAADLMGENKPIATLHQGELHRLERVSNEWLLVRAMVGGKQRPGWVHRSNVVKAQDPDAALRTLLVERLKTLRRRHDALLAAYADDFTSEQLFIITRSSRDLLEAEVQITEEPKRKIALYQEYLTEMKEVESRIESLNLAGRKGGETQHYEQAKAARLDAEIMLLRARRSANFFSVDE